MLSILFLVMAYILGSVPSEVWIARAISPGHLFRLGGTRAGALTFCADFLKGFLPVLGALLYWPADPYPAGLAALLVMIGHRYSVLLFFRGGKGVATMIGALFPLAPVAMVVALLAGATTFVVMRNAALAAMLAVFALLGALFALQASAFILSVAALCGWMVVRQHLGNLEKLLLLRQDLPLEL